MVLWSVLKRAVNSFRVIIKEFMHESSDRGDDSTSDHDVNVDDL